MIRRDDNSLSINKLSSLFVGSTQLLYSYYIVILSLFHDITLKHYLRE